MNAVVPSQSDDIWRAVPTPMPSREGALAAGRARVANGDWPPALAVADAIIAQFAFRRCRGVLWSA
jgi:hypothetical protein